MAEHAHTTSRRSLLTAAPTALALAGTASAPERQDSALAQPSPDADLLDLCAEFHRHHAAGHDDANSGWEAALQERCKVYIELEGLVPATFAGHFAKARVAVVLLAENQYEEFSGDPDARFALATLRGLVGMTGT